MRLSRWVAPSRGPFRRTRSLAPRSHLPQLSTPFSSKVCHRGDGRRCAWNESCPRGWSRRRGEWKLVSESWTASRLQNRWTYLRCNQLPPAPTRSQRLQKLRHWQRQCWPLRHSRNVNRVAAWNRWEPWEHPPRKPHAHHRSEMKWSCTCQRRRGERCGPYDVSQPLSQSAGRCRWWKIFLQIRELISFFLL